MSNHYEVYAIHYAEFTKRTRRDSFIFDSTHDAHDYFIKVK